MKQSDVRLARRPYQGPLSIAQGNLLLASQRVNDAMRHGPGTTGELDQAVDYAEMAARMLRDVRRRVKAGRFEEVARVVPDCILAPEDRR